MIMRLLRYIIFVAIMAMAMQSGECAGNDIERKMKEYGLVDIATLDKGIVVNLKYATTDNFVGKNMYGDFHKAYFRPEIARALVRVQAALRKHNQHYSLIIYDASRPQSVQRTMYDIVKNTPYRRYVAKPNRGGHHNFGIAVDISIVCDGSPIDMGTGFDSFSIVSHIDNEKALLKSGKLSGKAYENRQLLRKLMRAQGFATYRREWWHFQQYDIKYARQHFRLLDF